MQLKISTNMADDMTECMFTAGSLVVVITCYDETIEGEVIAFDYKSVSSNGQGGLNDVHWVNLDFAKNVSIKKEVKKEDVNSTQILSISTQRVEQRARAAIDERKKLAEMVDSGVSQDGIKIFLNLTKTIDGPVILDGDSIVVMNVVKINSPYKVGNVTPVPDTKTNTTEPLKYVKKLIEKYWNDQQKYNNNNNNNNKSSAMTPVTVTVTGQNEKTVYNNKG